MPVTFFVYRYSLNNCLTIFKKLMQTTYYYFFFKYRSDAIYSNKIGAYRFPNFYYFRIYKQLVLYFKQSYTQMKIKISLKINLKFLLCFNLFIKLIFGKMLIKCSYSTSAFWNYIPLGSLLMRRLGVNVKVVTEHIFFSFFPL